MISNTFKHCNNCGASYYPALDTWPKACTSCGNETFRNPTPVALAVIQMETGGVLLVRRAGDVEGSGKLAFPGGYIEWGETWQEGMAREVREETGLVLPPEAFSLWDVQSTPSRANVLIFGLASAKTSDVHFVPNKEVSEVVYATSPVELAFGSHTEKLKSFFGKA